jgi:hypothetical protein
MPETPQPASLLEQLDAAQEEVLRNLDDLNTRIEAVIREWTRPAGSGTAVSEQA